MLKEPKIYFFDNGLVNGNQGVKFENLVATSLLKHVYAKIDYLAENYTLKYLQTKEGHEVDFAIMCDQKIEKIIKVKLADSVLGKGIRYFHEKYKLSAVQIVKELRYEKIDSGVKIIDGLNFLNSLYL